MQADLKRIQPEFAMKIDRRLIAKFACSTLVLMGLIVIFSFVRQLYTSNKTNSTNKPPQTGNGSSLSASVLVRADQSKRSAQSIRTFRNEPLPPVGSPLATNYSELFKRARSGDTVAAMRLVSDLDQCHLRRIKLRTLNSVGFPENTSPTRTLDQSPAYGEVPQATKKVLKSLDATDTLCEGITDKQIDERGEALRLAAIYGDAQAMVCYASSIEQFGPPYLSAEWFNYVDRWRTEVIPFMQRAFDAGQADVIPLFIAALAPPAPDTINSYEVGYGLVVPNRQTAYSLALLYQKLVPQSESEMASRDVRDLMNGLDVDQISVAQRFVDSVWPRFAPSAGKQANVYPCSEFMKTRMD